MPAEDLTWALKSTSLRAPLHVRYRNYYEGRHSVTLSASTGSTFRSLFARFADNLCGSVVDVPAERLEVETFTGGAGEAAYTVWEDNEMPLRAAEVMTTALSEADAYVLVWPDVDNVPRIWPQRSDEVSVCYDRARPGTVIRAAKVWGADDVDTGGSRSYRVNLYYPEYIERWVTKTRVSGLPDKGDDLVPWEMDPDGDGPVLLNPWGEVPMFPFHNGHRVGGPGKSELVDVVPLQDALNKSVIDMLVGMEHVALPQRWATGVEDPTPEVDELTGLVVPGQKPAFRPGVDKVWTARMGAEFGQFPAANLEQLLAIQDSFRRSIARVSGTPVHMLMQTGEFPSGEALRTAESRLVKKVKARQMMFGSRWLAVMRLALRMAGLSNPELKEVVWEDPETRNELLETQVQEAKQRLGVSRRQSLRELGYGEDTIDEMMSDREAEANELGAALLSSFDRQPGTPVNVARTLPYD